jgi:hypothetical protein
VSEQLTALVKQCMKDQDVLQKRLRQDWAIQGWPFYRAVWTEMGEAVQHIQSWLWWKQGKFGQPMSAETIAAVRMELVDAFHFGLCMHIVEAQKYANQPQVLSTVQGDYASFYVRCFQRWGEGINTERAINAMEDMVRAAIERHHFDINHFARSCIAVGMSLPMLLTWYRAKYTLNEFRWANGYNLPKGDPKVYVKLWPPINVVLHGEGVLKEYITLDGPPIEDNEHLTQIVEGAITEYGDKLEGALAAGAVTTYVWAQLYARYPGPIHHPEPATA